MIRNEAAEALALAEFFEICDEEQRRMLAFAGDVRRFAPDTVLYQHGEVAQGAYVLISGTLKVKPESNRGGSSHTLSEPGSVISAMALILAKPRPVTVHAVTEVRALFIPRPAFLKLVQQSPDLAQRMIDKVQNNIDHYLGALDPLRRWLKGNAE